MSVAVDVVAMEYIWVFRCKCNDPACMFSAFAIDDSWLGPNTYVVWTLRLNCVSNQGKSLAELPDEDGSK